VVLQLGGWAWNQQPLTVKNKLVTKTSKKPGTWTDPLDKRPKLWNMDIRFGTWNVRSLYRAGSLKTVSRELARYKLDLVGVQEVRWEGGGTEPAGEYTFFIIVLNVHAPTEDKTDDVKDSFCEELERVFDKFPKYHMEILLGDFKAKVGKEDIFKPTIGNKVYTKLVMIMELG
jgi:exonuclease III